MNQKKRSDARRITLKFPGTCKSCKTALPVGTKVLWYPGGTVYGFDCHPSPFAKKPQTPKASAPKAASKTQPVGLEQLAVLAQALQTNPSVLAMLTKLVNK